MDGRASFSDTLKELRNRKHLSRAKLAQRLKVHPSSIEKWERGDVLPDRARVEDVMRALALGDAERLLLLEAHTGHRLLPTLHNLPAVRNPYFTGRAEILAELHGQIVSGCRVALTQAISGLGGIGKTQLALEYVYRYQKAHTHLFWISADSLETLTREFCSLARDLELPEKDENDPSKVVRAVQRWLREYVDWLLILDNIEDLSLVNKFVPAGCLGAVVLTTRRQVTEPVAQRLELDVLSEDEGVLFLLKRSRNLALQNSLANVDAGKIISARAITLRLGNLPLALDQAGAYIAEVGCSLEDYLSLLTHEQRALLHRRGNVPTDHPQSVAFTFSLAFERVQQHNEAASDLLKLCALLAPDAIPLELFSQGAAYLGEALLSIAATPLMLDHILEVLQNYSLVRRDAASKTLSLHRLIQAVQRDTMTIEEQAAWRQRAVQALSAIFPEVEHKVWQLCERLTPHVQACIVNSNDLPLSVERVELLRKAADYLRVRAYWQQAEVLYQLAIEMQEQMLRPEHPQIAMLLYRLASVYNAQGNNEQAEPLFLRALHLLEQGYGANCAQMAYPLNNLGNLYREQGKYAQSEVLLVQALHLQEQTHGPEHPLLATPLYNLANLYQEIDHEEQATPLLERALHLLEGAYGSEHPDIAYPLNNLAALYCAQGRYEQAEFTALRALNIRKQAYGPEHPLLAFPLMELADVYRKTHQYKRAEETLQLVLHIRERSLGRDHLNTAETWHMYACIQQEQGNDEEAAALFQQALAVREKRLGQRDHRTLETALCYIALLRSSGRTAEATSLSSRFVQEAQIKTR
ncbi:MAG TPA: tetratricopeptide repeat protein [Ktedonobacteraceae bacterium]|nr:tetratricopeptide repeat protein [Ktedonobacteraceae bacterium]